MGQVDRLISRLWAAQPDPERFRAMMAARRSFVGVPASKSSVPPLPGSKGTFYPDYQLAVWDDGDRATRRHEVMHGIVNAARNVKEWEKAIPQWAARGSAFEDELLARLAGGADDVAFWPMSAYAATDPLKYALAMPAHAVGAIPLQIATRPGAMALTYGAGAGIGTAVGLPIGMALSDEEDQPPPEPPRRLRPFRETANPFLDEPE